MNCTVWGKELVSRRKDARFCSAKCRVSASRVTDKSVTDKSVTAIVTLKDRWLCQAEGCNLRNAPGHKNFCLYHWRISEGMATISLEDYTKLNDSQAEIDKALI
jgi:hypothetical protein